jgi:hypothetical protein
VNLSLRSPAQMGWRKMEHKGEMYYLVSGGARSRGYKRRAREREPVRLPVLPRDLRPSRRKALDLPFLDARRGSRCTMGGVAMR